MKAFEWTNPTSVGEAVKLLRVESRDGDVDDQPRPLAGGQDILTSMKEYITRPSRLVNLKGIRGLDKIEGDARRGLKIGALVTLTQLEENATVRRSFPGLAQAAESVATPQIRNLAPSRQPLPASACWYYRLEEVVCLKKGGTDATLRPARISTKPFSAAARLTSSTRPTSRRSVGARRERCDRRLWRKGTVPLDKFSRCRRKATFGARTCCRRRDLTDIQVPSSALAARSTYLKFKERASLDFALSSAAAH